MPPHRKPLARCEVCEQPVKRHGRTTCSRQCAGKVKHQGVDFTCPICGRVKHFPPSDLAGGRRQTCSPSCRREAAQRARVLAPCAYCGRPRERKPRYGLKQTGIYCGYSCSRRAAVERWRLAHPWPQCARCGEPVKRRERTYCSRQCAAQSPLTRTRDCAICGTAFRVLSSYPGRQHCSRRCADLSRRRREMRSCARCGKSFEAAVRSRQRYCDYACYAPGSPPRRRAGEVPRRRQCPACHGAIKAGTRHRQRFCSPACAYWGRGHARNSDKAVRDARIVALRAEGLRGRRLLAQLEVEHVGWGEITPAAMRQVLYRATHGGGAGSGRDKSNGLGRRPVARMMANA